MDSEEINKQRALDYIKSSLSSSLIGTPVDRQAVEDKLTRTLAHLKDRKVINGYEETPQISILWEDMGFKERFLWRVCNKWFPSIGEHYRELYTIAEMDIEVYNDVLQDIRPDTPPRFLVISNVPNIFCENPKAVVVSDMKIFPVQALEFINVNLVVGGED